MIMDWHCHGVLVRRPSQRHVLLGLNIASHSVKFLRQVTSKAESIRGQAKHVERGISE